MASVGSTGDWTTATIDELAGDARCAWEALRAHSEVAAGAIGVMGHSEGGWVALRLGVRARGIPHVILNSCPAVSFIDAEVFALTRLGLSVEDANAARSLLHALAEAAGAGDGLDAGQRIVADARRERWDAAVESSGFVLDGVAWAQLRAWGRYDPLPDLEALTTRTLVVLGADDPLVPVPASVRAYEESATRTRRCQRVTVFPDAGHRLQRATGGFAPGYIAAIADWSRRSA